MSLLKCRLALAGLLLVIAGASQAGPVFEAGSLPAKWFSAGPECATFRDDFQVHSYNANLYILRQSGCVSSDKPFLYLIFGQERAILFDTGAADDTAPASGRVPNVVGAVDQVINQWLARNKRQSIPLVVTHLHGHADHVAGDAQFANRPGTTFLKPDDVGALKGFFGITRWPGQSVAYDLGGRILDIVPVPGHDPTSIAVYDRQTAVLLTGDFVYPGRIYVNDPDPQVMQDSMQRLVDFTDSRPVTHVLGSHIEQRAPYVENPIGLHYAPQEVPLQLGRAHLLEVLEAARLRDGGRIVQKAYRDFTLCGKYPSCTPVNVSAGQ
ncbi:MBL fold metallo-hydrolase [Pseudomonas poae]|nr:MBL fold metallo-hydrolase [Pseudomonas poae]